MNYPALFVIGVALSMSACKSSYSTPYDYEGPVIVIGSGGGFTGQVEEYTVLSNGQLFFGTGNEGFVHTLPDLAKGDVAQIFKNYKDLGFDKLEIDKPGNMYHYLIYRNKDSTHKIQWGAYDANPPRELTIFFANLKKQFSALKAQKKDIRNSSNS